MTIEFSTMKVICEMRAWMRALGFENRGKDVTQSSQKVKSGISWGKCKNCLMMLRVCFSC